MIGTGSSPCDVSYARINSVASIPPINGIDTSILHAKFQPDHSLVVSDKTYQDDVEWPVPLNSRLERIDCQRSVFGNFHLMPILLQDLHRQLLVDEIIFCYQDIIGHVVLRYDWCNCV